MDNIKDYEENAPVTENVGADGDASKYDEFELLDEVLEISDRKLQEIGFVNVPDVVEAMHDEDSFGHSLTGFALSEARYDINTKEQLSQTDVITTFKAKCYVSSTGPYFTLSLQYAKRDYELEKLWTYLEDYGKRMLEIDQHSREFPVIMMTIVPFSLGGSYHMMAFDPIFWALQPAYPTDDEPREIRMLFENDNVMFLQLPYLSAGKMFAELKQEIAGERYTQTMRERDEEKRLQFEKEREEFLQQYISTHGSNRHSFSTQIKHGSFTGSDDIRYK